MVDGGIAEDDEDGFNAGHDGLFDALAAVNLCIDAVVDVHVVGSLEFLTVGVPYSGVEGVRGGLAELGFLASENVFPLEAGEVVAGFSPEGIFVKELLSQYFGKTPDDLPVGRAEVRIQRTGLFGGRESSRMYEKAPTTL